MVPFQLASTVIPAMMPAKPGSTTAVRLELPLVKRTLSPAEGTTPATQLAGLLQVARVPPLQTWSVGLTVCIKAPEALAKKVLSPL